RQVQKLMTTLPDRFRIKITSLESFQRIQNLSIDDLLSELFTFEINHGFDLMRVSKGKGLALNAKVRAAVAEEKEESDEESFDADEITKALTVLTKNVSKLKKFHKKMFQGNKPFEGGRNLIQKIGGKRSDMQLNKFQNANQGVEKDQCRECKGFGHLQKECPNFKKKNRTYKATWSDYNDDKDEESEKIEYSHYSNDSAKCLLNEYNYFTSSVNLTDVESDAGSYANNLRDAESDEFLTQLLRILSTKIKKGKMKLMEHRSTEHEKEIIYLKDELQKMRVMTVDLNEKLIKSDLHIGKQDKNLNRCFAKLALVEHGDKLNKHASDEQNFTIESLRNELF
ncbi:Unknown protein, partial [Striga hermonthica]